MKTFNIINFFLLFLIFINLGVIIFVSIGTYKYLQVVNTLDEEILLVESTNPSSIEWGTTLVLKDSRIDEVSGTAEVITSTGKKLFSTEIKNLHGDVTQVNRLCKDLRIITVSTEPEQIKFIGSECT